MIPRRDPPPEKERGAHTLRVWRGTVVGLHGDDVFVELGERMQGVISVRQFAEPPRPGAVFEFTLRGQEESLWVLALRTAQSLSTWERIEEEEIVEARVVRAKPGGLELKVGALHAFMPASQTGLPRERKPEELVGKTLSCEVIEVDRERQRVVLSRKQYLRREREQAGAARLAGLRVGAVVQGRVTRLESYGAFVRFGRGLEGLVHVSDVAWERVEHPARLLRTGQVVEAKVLSLRRHGKRIALGLKQLTPSPWRAFARAHAPDELVTGVVTGVSEHGAFVAVAPGVRGLVRRAETGLGPGLPLRHALAEGARVSVRILELDPEVQRLTLSLLHRSGRRIAPDEAELAADAAELDAAGAGGVPSPLGALLRRALAGPQRAAASSSGAAPREGSGDHAGAAGCAPAG
jgi:ribosomal protein S1